MPTPTTNSASTVNSNNTLSIASNRKFGVEIEFVGMSQRVAIRALVDAGIPVNHTLSGYYNHTDSESEWKVVTDGSVSGPGGGGEAVSPILSGIEGLEQVRRAADALSNAGATANRSCGLHVHVDARDLEGRDIANVVTRYAKFETDIDAFMPRSRRGRNGSSYCDSIANIRGFSTPQAFTTTSQVMRAWGGDRFRKVNLCSYTSHGSIEIRHHSGTVQSSKILPWIQFCVNFVEKSRMTPVATRIHSARTGGRAGDSKTLVAFHKIVNRLDRAGYRGTTITDLSNVAGISETSIVVYISNLRTKYGFSIKKRRGADMYYLVRNGELPALAGALEPTDRVSVTSFAAAPADDSAFFGLPGNVTNYFSERTSELAAA